jgi:hypothetical protein
MVYVMNCSIRVFVLCLLVPIGCAEETTHAPTCTDPNVPRSPRPDVPLRRQTEHLDIYSEGFVCAGMAVELERHVEFASSQFGIDLREHIPVYLFEDRPEPCGGRLDGCVAADGAVFTTPHSTYHQLGHSAVCELRANARPALAEGVAVMFEPTPETHRMGHDEGWLELIEQPTRDLSDANAGHFVRWLYERDGAESVAELYGRSGDSTSTIAALEEIFGASLEQLESEYFASAPYAWSPFRQCADIPHVQRDDDGVWRHSSIIDCESESTMGPYTTPDSLSWLYPSSEWNVMVQSFTFTIEEEIALDYDFQGDIERVLLWRCGDEHPSSGDNDVFAHSWMTPKDWVGNQSRPQLRPGTWRADVLVAHGPAAPIGLSFWEDPGDPPSP